MAENDGTIAASEEMREYFGLQRMPAPAAARAWFETLWQQAPIAAEAVAYFRGLRLEIGTLEQEMGGGYWFGDRNLVLLRGTQQEAAIHELAHAWWERQRTTRRDALMVELQHLAANPPADCPTIAELAQVYCHGIPTQPDPSSPTGYWRGMLAEDNDHETFAGFCSGVRGDATRMPPSLRAFYTGFLRGA
jgi:hypothetical protein